MTGAAKLAVAFLAFLCCGFFALLLFLGMGSGLGDIAQAAAACTPRLTGAGGQPVTGAVANVPGGSVAGYSGQQLANAAIVMKAGADQGFGVRGQTIGVMTAMGESGLQELTYGDKAGPDSRGLFQQRANGAWGSLADRMDPYISATSFFRAAKLVPGWEQMPPTLSAHAVQRNADPYYYTRYWNPAVQVVQALAGASVQLTGVAQNTGDQVCTAQAPGAVTPGAGGWTNPAPGTRLTSGFGNRPATAVSPAQFHAGQDLAAACGTPIYAAAAGTVISSGPASGFGDWIRIDHGGGIVTVYGHMYAGDLLVSVGAKVAAGQQISRIGQNGEATGCHLHFEVHVNGTPVDPGPWMAQRGATL